MLPSVVPKMNKLNMLCAALVAALPTATQAATFTPTCALAPSAAVEATLNSAKVMPELGTALQETGGCILQDPAKTAPELETARSMGFDCSSEDTECLRKLAALLRVQRVIGVSATQKEAVLLLALVVVDAKRGDRLAEVAGEIAIADPALGAALRDLAKRLLTPAPAYGSLRLTIAEPGAQVLLDGKPIGTTPLAEPVQGLPPGAHALQIKRAGCETAEQQVELAAGAESSVEIKLSCTEVAAADDQPKLSAAAKTGPPPWDIVGWSLAGGGGGVALLSGLGALAFESMLDFSDAGDFETRAGWQLAGRVLSGVTVVGLVAGVAGLGVVMMTERE